MSVPIPPILQAYAILSMRASSKFVFSLVDFKSDDSLFSAPRSINASIERAIGNIIIAVAVLLTHILKKAAATINPKIIDFGATPTLDTMTSATLRCKSHFSIAMASIKPPKKRKINGLA